MPSLSRSVKNSAPGMVMVSAVPVMVMVSTRPYWKSYGRPGSLESMLTFSNVPIWGQTS